MKKELKGLFVCLIGFGMGFLSLLYSNEAVQSLEECTRKVVNPSIKDKRDWIFSSIGNIGIVLLIVAVITAIVLAVIRFFANSKCMQSAITIGQFVTDVILLLYITEVIYITAISCSRNVFIQRWEILYILECIIRICGILYLYIHLVQPIC